MTGRQVALSVVVIILVTAVLPPAAAWSVNKRRVSRAGRDVARIASQLRAVSQPNESGVFEGPGNVPQATSPDATAWLTEPRHPLVAVLAGSTVPRDPWGNGYLANDTWVLSAGPNGTLETGFRATMTSGDDVGRRR